MLITDDSASSSRRCASHIALPGYSIGRMLPKLTTIDET